MRSWKRLLAIAIICGFVGIAAGIAVWYFVQQERRAGAVVTSTDKSKLQPVYNSLFNTSDEKDFGLWIYEAKGNCPNLRGLDKSPLVIVAPRSFSGEGTIQVKELKSCFELDLAKPNTPGMTKCVEGFVKLENSKSTGDKIGSYDIALGNGKQRKGDLRATFCPTSK